MSISFLNNLSAFNFLKSNACIVTTETECVRQSDLHIPFLCLVKGKVQCIINLRVFIAIFVAWFLDMTLLKPLGTAEWEKRKQDAFQAVTAAVEEAVATGMTHKDELIAKFVDAGFSKKEAEALAKEAILKELRE